MTWDEMEPLLTQGTIDTLYMVGWSTLYTVLGGLPLGVLLVLTDQGGPLRNAVVNKALSLIVNVGPVAAVRHPAGAADPVHPLPRRHRHRPDRRHRSAVHRRHPFLRAAGRDLPARGRPRPHRSRLGDGRRHLDGGAEGDAAAGPAVARGQPDQHRHRADRLLGDGRRRGRRRAGLPSPSTTATSGSRTGCCSCWCWSSSSSSPPSSCWATPWCGSCAAASAPAPEPVPRCESLAKPPAPDRHRTPKKHTPKGTFRAYHRTPPFRGRPGRHCRPHPGPDRLRHRLRPLVRRRGRERG